MPRKGSFLLEFLLERLNNTKYPNVLFWISESQKILAIQIARKSSKNYCEEEDALFEEWSLVKGHESDPADNRQRFLQAVKRSKFLIICKPEQLRDCDKQLSKDLLLLKLAEDAQETNFKLFEQIEEMDCEPLEQPEEMDSKPLELGEEMGIKFLEQESAQFSILEQTKNIEVVTSDIPMDEIKFPMNYDPVEELQNACRIHTVPNMPVVQPEVDSFDSSFYKLDVYMTDSFDGGNVIVKEKVSLNNPVTPSSSYMIVIKPK
ncbi:uncharacterized protein LOC118186204 isoform X2 [Stegodyphus dumicola]|nr:uncharacterized protein LOC118186204 isoform X2 [Stegodyphus dumicola]